MRLIKPTQRPLSQQQRSREPNERPWQKITLNSRQVNHCREGTRDQMLQVYEVS
jgi:hypothetical protein